MSFKIDNLRDPLGLLLVSYGTLFMIYGVLEVVILDLEFGQGLRVMFLLTIGTGIAKLFHDEYGVDTTAD